MKSQYNEEEIILNFFSGSELGAFLDVGAFDGVKDSNTHALAENGWRGVYVEPNLKTFWNLKRNKGDDHVCLHGACGRSGGISEIVTSNDVPELSTLHHDTTKLAHMASLFHGREHVPVFTVNELHGKFWNFDFISIDAEGMDYDVICGSMNALLHCKLVCVEKGLPGRRDDEPEYQIQTDLINDFMTRIGWILHTENKANIFYKSPLCSQ